MMGYDLYRDTKWGARSFAGRIGIVVDPCPVDITDPNERPKRSARERFHDALPSGGPSIYPEVVPRA